MLTVKKYADDARYALVDDNGETVAYVCTREDADRLARLWNEDEDEAADSADYDDSMDGDFDSAMASAGLGTDEAYGCYDGGGDNF